MNAQLLATKPISGEFPEIPFDARGNCIWIKFTDNSLSEWCGVFGCGDFGSSLVTVRPDICVSFVLASGQGYWIDTEKRALLGKTRRDDFQVAIWPGGSDFVIAATWTNVFFIDPEGVVWDSGRISWDGISFGSYDDGVLRGTVNDLSEHGCEFTLDVAAKNVVGAPDFPTEAV